MKLFRSRMRQRATTGVHITGEVMAIATVEHEPGRKPRLIQASSHDLSTPSDSSRADSARVLRETLKSGRTPVSLVLDNEHYDLLLVEAPRVEPSELRAAVRWKVKSLIDFHIDDAVIDVFEIPGQKNRPQGQSMMYAIAARARKIREYVDLFENADLNLQVIDVADMALRNLAAQLEDDVRGVAMLHLERTHGVITITRQGSLYLSRRLETGHETIEQGGADQLILEVQRSLDYYDSHFAQPPVGSLCLLPGFFGRDDLLAALSDGLDMNVTPFDAATILDCNVQLPEQHLNEVLVAVGGALRREEISL